MTATAPVRALLAPDITAVHAAAWHWLEETRHGTISRCHICERDAHRLTTALLPALEGAKA